VREYAVPRMFNALCGEHDDGLSLDRSLRSSPLGLPIGFFMRICLRYISSFLHTCHVSNQCS
jgi:hypothetical protein